MNSPNPVPQTQPVLPPAPWYTSDVQVRMVIAIVGQLVSLVFRTLPMLGINFDASAIDVDAVVANITQGVAIVFGLLAIVKRQQSPVAPLTLTQKAAEDRTKINPPLLESDPTKFR